MPKHTVWLQYLVYCIGALFVDTAGSLWAVAALLLVSEILPFVLLILVYADQTPVPGCCQSSACGIGPC